MPHFSFLKSCFIITFFFLPAVLDFHHYDKVPEKIKLKGRKGFWILVSEVSVHVWWTLLFFEIHGKADHYDGGSCVV
jgi:hypothetical protein